MPVVFEPGYYVLFHHYELVLQLRDLVVHPLPGKSFGIKAARVLELGYLPLNAGLLFQKLHLFWA